MSRLFWEVYLYTLIGMCVMVSRLYESIIIGFIFYAIVLFCLVSLVKGYRKK